VDDILYPQLDKMEQAIRALFEEHEFHVINSGYWANEEAIILIELTTAQLPFVKKHRGPPVWSYAHAKGFKDKYVGSDELFSLYIEDGFYIADIRRKFTTAKELLEGKLQQCSLGKHLCKTVESGFTILENTDIAKVNDPNFRKFLRKWEQGR
jgi:tRNA nucleotidyltransferase (CCA-adding enzyme)